MISPLLPSDDQNDVGNDSNNNHPSSATTTAPSPSSANPFPDYSLTNATPLETAQYWAENTSIHGMYYMLERGHFQRWKTFAWTTIVIAATGGLLWALIMEVADFHKYNVDTNTEVKIEPSLPFPIVTICNSNGGMDAMRQNATGIVEPRNEEELLAISQPLEEFITYTEFNQNERIITEAWTPIITPLGRCFAFITNENVFVPGISAGLTVHAWLDQANYPETTEWAGVHVFVNPLFPPKRNGKSYNKSNNDDNNEKMISHQASGAVLVPPGAVSFVAISRQDFERVEDGPWSKCRPEEENNEFVSSTEECRMECLMSATKRKCNCRIIGDTSEANLYDYCNSTIHKECISPSLNDDDLAICQTCSIPPCKEQVFKARYSAGRITQRIIDRVKKTTGATDDEMSTNFVAIHVNFDFIRYELTTESKSTSPSQLVSNLGGSFGFFMGISMISIIELFVELIGLRLIPNLVWGKRQLFGIGQNKKFD